MKIIQLVFYALLLICGTTQAQISKMFVIKKDSSGFQLTEKGASHLASLPLKCIEQEFPNKTSHTSNSASDHVLMPRQLHPAFYGCFDWHSCVHGHWMLVKLLKLFPNLPEANIIRNTINKTITKENIAQEVRYFDMPLTASWERTYGWAWLLKLDEELISWNDEDGKQWHEALQPLVQKVVDVWIKYLPKQTYPNRTGVHPNTAFGLVFALDWSRTLRDTAFEHAIIKKAKEFYLNNIATPAYLEPDGSDFLSPSLEIADLVKRIIPKQQFITWLNKFYDARSIKRITEMPIVSDRTDFQIVHLDGLALSRAWCMKGIAKELPVSHPWKKLFEKTANDFIKSALPNVTSGNYGGDHWLASFALYALSQ